MPRLFGWLVSAWKRRRVFQPNFFGLSPLPVRVTTKIIFCRGSQPKPSFATIILRGVVPTQRYIFHSKNSSRKQVFKNYSDFLDGQSSKPWNKKCLKTSTFSGPLGFFSALVFFHGSSTNPPRATYPPPRNSWPY